MVTVTTNGNGQTVAAGRVAVTTFAGTTTINALPAVVNLELYAGDDFLMTAEVTLPDETPVDFAGFQIDAQVRATAADPAVAGTWDVEVAANVITLHLPHAVTETLPPRSVYDVQTVAPDGFVLTVMRGSIDLTADVTRL